MNLIKVGEFFCKYCKKELPAYLYTDSEDVNEYKEDVIDWVKNYHWYDNHYNCAVCGKWIVNNQRELAIEEKFKHPIHADYNYSDRTGLLRVHKSCIENLIKT